VLFIDLNADAGTLTPPDVDDAERTMITIAAGAIDEATVSDWLRARVHFA
jgi:hypothetical protein